jgi:hypothetical protein
MKDENSTQRRKDARAQGENNFNSLLLCSAILQDRRVPRRFSVAQIFNLLFRGISFCAAFAGATDSTRSDVLPIANRRYSRVQLCATLVAAWPRHALASLR